jgi:aspartate-semialdehyde dehydrogenase
VAIVGATGLVGRKMLQVLEEHRFPVGELRPLASARSAGTTIAYGGTQVTVQTLAAGSFRGVDVALFSAGASVSREFAPHAVREGTLVIDNSSAFRMDRGVPLIVPEVNGKDIVLHRGIIANPNCSTIQMVVALKPLHDLWKIRRIVVSTYQSVTGAGKKGLTQLEEEIARTDGGEKKFPHPIAFNILPQVDVFHDDGYTKEEYKMMDETRKIMGDDNILVSATCVRVPVWGGHSESVNVEFHRPCDPDIARESLRKAPGVIVQDNPGASEYPMPVLAWDRDEVYVGRIRRDPTVASGLNLWVVADNLRKGAATNAVQIAEAWVKAQQ